MLFKSGSYTGNGTRKFIDLGFKPVAILMKADTTQYMAFYTPRMWCERTNVAGLSSSYISGIKPSDMGFYVGSATAVNSSGIVHHYIAIGDDGSGDMETQAWSGDQTAGRVIKLKATGTPIAAMIKRDGPREAALKIGSNSTIFMQGTAATDCISLGAGAVTLTAAVQVNEWDSAGGLGEGIDGLFLFNSVNCNVVSWTGNGVAGRVIETGLPNITAAIVSNPAAGGSSRLLTASMAGSAGPVTSGSALTANEATLVGSTIVIGSNHAALNNVAGYQYGAIVFSEKTTSTKAPAPLIKVKNKQAVYLPANGIASYINCGTSDATLKIDGAITYEWFGASFFNPLAGAILDNHIIARGHPSNSSLYGNANGYSWGLMLGAPNDGYLGWANAQYCPQTHNIMGMDGAELNTNSWRSGILAKFGQMEHFIATVAADGNAVIYVNGEMVKQRKNTNSAVTSVAGHITIIGARYSGGAAVRNSRLILRELAIYNRALTADEARARYERSVFGSTGSPDVTSGRAAWWHADNAGGNSLPDAVNSANNGTINAGVVLTL